MWSIEFPFIADKTNVRADLVFTHPSGTRVSPASYYGTAAEKKALRLIDLLKTASIIPPDPGDGRWQQIYDHRISRLYQSLIHSEL